MNKVWNASRVRLLLMNNDRAVERGILAIYDGQTLDEKQSDATRHHNNIGFNAPDARRGSYYARWIRSGRRLTGKHLDKARMIMMKYAGQLVRIIDAKATQ